MAKTSADQGSASEGGFTLLEMIAALTLMAIVMTFSAQVLYGAFGALSAARQRSSFVEIANAEVEVLRAQPYASVGVRPTDQTASNYPAGVRNNPGAQTHGKKFVPAGNGALPAVQVVNSPADIGVSVPEGVPLPFTVRRWVVWQREGTRDVHKIIEVQVSWTENRKSARSVSFFSTVYPGGLGVTGVAANQAPSPVITYTVPGGGTVIREDVAIDFHSDQSTDPDGNVPLTYTWNFGDGTGTINAGVNTTQPHTFSRTGAYTVSMVAKDSKGRRATATKVVQVVRLVNRAPTAAFSHTITPTSAIAPATVNVDSSGGSRSTDPDGDPLTYTWSWGDGTPDGTGSSAGHLYTSAGTYALTLTVSDGEFTDTETVPGGIVIRPLSCQVGQTGSSVAGYLLNPETVTATRDRNKIQITTAGLPVNPTFKFVAYTNRACNALEISLPATPASGSGPYVVSLTKDGPEEADGDQVWSRNISISSVQFSRGNNQVATISARPGASGNFQFDVQR